MPKGSRREAARQAELSRRKKTHPTSPHSGPTSVIKPEPPSTGVPVAEAAVNAVPVVPPNEMPQAASSPPQSLRQPAFSAPRSAAQAISAARRALPTSPYLMSDLKLIGVLAVAMIIALVVLDIAVL